jgi:hypothetical protein
MCCFTQPVEAVSDTSIFARAAANGRQYLAYAMRVRSRQPVAMVLPLPTPKRAPADAVRFVKLDGYPDLFDDLAAAFARPLPAGVPLATPGAAVDGAAPLPVAQVGSFVASFVPSVGDFGRLDARFRMPAGTWEGLPRYKEYGFAVFQLKPGDQRVHPMAFEFPRANPDWLFFPTVHVHDGRVHQTAGFDHALYAQTAKVSRGPWEASSKPAGKAVAVARTQGLVSAAEPLVRRLMTGTLPNADVLL